MAKVTDEYSFPKQGYFADPNKDYTPKDLRSKVGIRQTRLDLYRDQLTDQEFKLLEPLIMSDYSDAEIGNHLADIRSSLEDREYNSEVNKAARLRAAGINPDLVGLGESSESSLPMSPAHQDLPSSGGHGTLGARFVDLSSKLLQFATFGVNAYGAITDRVISEGMNLAGFAASDVLSLAGDESGKVKDVDSSVLQLVNQRGFRGNRASRYASMVRQRINSLPVVLQRVKNASDYEANQASYKLNAFKNSDEYMNTTYDLLRAQAAKQLNMDQRDAEEARLKLEFLKAHPEYTPEMLDAALRKSKAEAGKAEADEKSAQIGVSTASSMASKAASDARTAEERAQQAESDTPRVQSDNAVRQLKNDLYTVEMEGYDEMIEFCNEWERRLAGIQPLYRYDYKVKHSDDWNKYRAYRKLVRKTYKGKSGSKVAVSAGPVSASFGD